MSALALLQSATAVLPNITANFTATGGTSPYIYSVLPGGAGGSIDEMTGVYTAPVQFNTSDDPTLSLDTIEAQDMNGDTVDAQILVGSPLLLVCEIIQKELALDSQHCYLWDQKILQPTDSELYVAISVPRCKPFSNINEFDSDGNSVQGVNMLAQVEFDIISRGASARDRKEEVVLALNSNYAQSQQELNGFYLGKLPPNSQFQNLSLVDGAAIPYRYKISIQMQYIFTKTTAVPYFNTFQTPNTTPDP